MAAGLLLATGAFYWSASRALQESVSPAVLRSDLLIVLASIVVAGTAATLMGAWHFTSSAVRPVSEITAQATRIEREPSTSVSSPTPTPRSTRGWSPC